MALRLIDSVSKPTRALTAAQLAERATVALATGDVGAYGALFDQASEIADVHRRHQARLALIDAGMAALGTLGGPTAAAALLAIGEQVVAALDAEPREPALLNAAGIALYELGSLRAARDLFRAAARLDPKLPHVDDNLEQTARRLRAGWRATLPAQVAAALPALTARAAARAKRAHPAQGLTLSLCMIVRDEEEMLPRCLEAVRDAVDEIVIVDTGSVDRTIEIARSFGARVIEREWTGSFSEARNVSFDAATGDWVMYLDADEVLVREDAALLRELTARTWREAFYLVETSYVGELEDGQAVAHHALRVFRNRPEYRFEGRIHEQIGNRLPLFLAERMEATPIRVEHFGYLGAVRDTKDKSRRNVELLERQREESGDSPFLGFNLGSEHAALGDHARAAAEFRAAWEQLRKDPATAAATGFAPTLISRLVRALRNCGEATAAAALAGEGLALFPSFTDLVLEQARAAQATGDDGAAAALLERCLQMGDAPTGYTATVGSGTYLALVELAGVRRRQGDLAESERLLTDCLRDHPRFLASVEPLAQAMLARGAGPDAVVRHIASCTGEMEPSAHFVLGLALYEAGHAVAAEPHFREVVARQPAADIARVALAEALLSQARFAEAAALAAELAPDSQCAPAARRAEAFARILAGDLDAAGRVAGDPALPPAEAALFGAWCALPAGTPPPAHVRLPAECAGPLEVALEALLRLGEVDAVPALLNLLECVALPWRERRELAAGVYLRRGFLESAADEWIAVCGEAGPDARALIGLAQVALAQGMPDEALCFAQETQVLEPGHAGAARIVERLAA